GARLAQGGAHLSAGPPHGPHPRHARGRNPQHHRDVAEGEAHAVGTRQVCAPWPVAGAPTICGRLLTSIANHLYIVSALLMRGAHRRRSCKAEQGVASPERFATARGRTTPSTPGGRTPRAAIAAWSREEPKQNAGPGPKNVTVERRE